MLKNPDASVGDWSKYPLPKIGSTVTRTPGKPAPVTPSRTNPRTPKESGGGPVVRKKVPADHTYTEVEGGADPRAFAARSPLPDRGRREKKPGAVGRAGGRSGP